MIKNEGSDTLQIPISSPHDEVRHVLIEVPVRRWRCKAVYLFFNLLAERYRQPVEVVSSLMNSEMWLNALLSYLDIYITCACAVSRELSTAA